MCPSDHGKQNHNLINYAKYMERRDSTAYRLLYNAISKLETIFHKYCD